MNDFGLCNKHFDEQNEEEDCIVCEKDKAIKCVKARNENLQKQIEEPKTSRTAIDKIITDHYKKACRIPEEWNHMIVEIVMSQMDALGITLGNLELCYRRTMMHHEELKDRK